MKKVIFVLMLIVLAALMALSCGDDDDQSTDSVQDDDDDDDQSDDDTANDDDTADDDTDDDDDDDDDNDDDDGGPYDPALPGPYEVGNRSAVYVDRFRYDPATNSSRMLMTEVWYPAVDQAAELPRDVIRNFLGQWAEMVMERLAEEGVPPEELENFDRETGSARDAPMNTEHGPYPMILFSHGLAGVRFQNYTLCEYLASHGFVVIAPDHTGNAMVSPLPDEPIEFNEDLVFISYWQRKHDLSFLIDKFIDLNENDPDAFYTDMIATEKVGAMGHSFGGTASVEATKDDQRIRATIDFASFMFPWFTDPFDSSLMWMIGMEDNTMGDVTFLMRYDYMISPAPKFKLEFADGGHYTFTDTCILMPSFLGNGDGCGMGERRWGGEPFEYIGHDTAFSIIYPYATAFYGFNLRNEQHMKQYLEDNHFTEHIEYEHRF